MGFGARRNVTGISQMLSSTHPFVKPSVSEVDLAQTGEFASVDGKSNTESLSIPSTPASALSRPECACTPAGEGKHPKHTSKVFWQKSDLIERVSAKEQIVRHSSRNGKAMQSERTGNSSQARMVKCDERHTINPGQRVQRSCSLPSRRAQDKSPSTRKSGSAQRQTPGSTRSPRKHISVGESGITCECQRQMLECI